MQSNGKAPRSANGALIDEAVPPQSAALTLQDTGAAVQGFAAPPAQPPAVPARRIVATMRRDIASRLVAAQIAIDTVMTNPTLQATMAAYGYDVARMAEGQALCERAQTLYNQQRARFGDRLAATKEQASMQAQAHAIYMRHVTIARVALRGDLRTEQALGLAEARRYTQAGWLIQAQQFYANTLGNRAIEQKLAASGATLEQLTHGQRMVTAIRSTLMAQQASKDASAALTKERDAALASLKRWMRDFRAIARVVLAEQQG